MGRNGSLVWVRLRGKVGLMTVVENMMACIYSILVKHVVASSLFLLHIILWGGLHSYSNNNFFVKIRGVSELGAKAS